MQNMHSLGQFRYIFGEFRGISQISEAKTATRMKIDPYSNIPRWRSVGGRHLEFDRTGNSAIRSCTIGKSDSGFLYAPIVTISLSLTIRLQFAIECL